MILENTSVRSKLLGTLFRSEMNSDITEKKKSIPPTSIALPPDLAILMQARVEAGNRNIKLKNVASLLLHDPVLSMEFLQSANSALFSGAPITDIDSALVRLGSARVVVELGDMFLREQIKDFEIADVLEVLRYQSRRVSIVSLIIASALRPSLATVARISGLFSDIGHMIALLHLGGTYVETLKKHQRKNMAYRLEKDNKFNLDNMRVKYLRAKGIPEKLIVPYDLELALKAPGDVDLRAIVRAAMAMIDASDSGKFDLYSPDKQLPSQSDLRLLKMTPIQHERLYSTILEYLKKTAELEAPEAASLLIVSDAKEDIMELNEGKPDQLKVPHYPITAVKSGSRTKLEDFFSACEQATDPEKLKFVAIESLTKSGFFSRAALVQVPQNSNTAVIQYSIGLDVASGEKLELTDPLSPFLMFRLDIKSFQSKSKSASTPFGSTAFAVGPLGIGEDGTKTILYADSIGKGLTMECRAVFRLAMNVLISQLEAMKNSEKIEVAS